MRFSASNLGVTTQKTPNLPPASAVSPIEDAAHARNAKARAAQQERAGKLSAADKKKVDAKADKVLKH